MLEPLARSEKELPSDYNPPARLALIHRELGQHKEALAAVERALKKCKEGPRRLRLYDVKAGLQQKAGDEKGAKATRVDALKYAKKLPKSQISEKRLAAIEAASR